MKSSIIVILLFTFSYGSIAQKKLCSLPNELNESSGLIALSDNRFLTINDSGNKAEVYVFNQLGEIVNICTIKKAENTDWESLTRSKKYLYIGDIGNNENKRKNLAIYKLDLDDVSTTKNSTAQKISLKYPNQEKFPPKKDKLYFDAEALSYYNNKLWIFTKNRTDPFDGISYVYSLDTKERKAKVKKQTNIYLKPSSWLEDCITGSQIYKEHLFLLTYSKIYVYDIDNNNLKWNKTIKLSRFGQWEGISCTDKGIYLTEEAQFGMPAGLYFIPYE